MLVKERVETIPFYGDVDQIPVVPSIIYDRSNPTEVQAISYSIDGKKYYFSNDEGHKVYNGTMSSPRPMTKKEFKDICSLMVLNASQYGELEETVLAEIEKLDFAEGHANSTFEVVQSCMGFSRIGALALNIGTARYLYNQDANTVFHIDHSKLINGTMMKSPEKDEIIAKITSSKTMTKKIQRVLNS